MKSILFALLALLLLNASFAACPAASREIRLAAVTGETSGGLLIAVPEARHETLLDELVSRDVMAATIGRIREASEGSLELVVSKGARGEKR